MLDGFRTANNIIDESLAALRDEGRTMYNEAAMYFDRGFREFRLFHDSGSIKESWQPVTAINTVNYPKDLLKLISVGVVVDKEFFTFTRSDKMVAPITSPIDASLDSDREEDSTLRRTPTYGYGTKAGNVEYYYKDDKVGRRIVLGRMALDITRYASRSEVLVQYVSTGLDNLDETYIPNEAANLLMAYIEYKLVESRPEKYGRAYIADKKQNYFEEKAMVAALEMPSLDELIDVIYETSSQLPRRI